MTPLHHLGNFVRELLLQVPLPVVRVLFLAVLGALLVWVLLLPREQTTPPRANVKPVENLKYWAALALGIQLVIYLLL